MNSFANTMFAMLFGGAQKNIAPAGLTVCIIREDMLGNARDITPTMLNYKTMADADSLYNTPPCFTIYMCKLVLEWIKEQGGLEAVKANNVKKAQLLYDYFDSSRMFKNIVNKEWHQGECHSKGYHRVRYVIKMKIVRTKIKATSDTESRGQSVNAVYHIDGIDNTNSSKYS